MSLDEKTINPAVPAESPGKNSDLLPKSGKKRRKSQGAAPRKAKQYEDEDDSAEVTAVLTMGDAPRKQPKKMLFEPDADGGPVALPASVAPKDRNGSMRTALSTTAAVMPASLPTQSAAAPELPAPKASAPAETPTLEPIDRPHEEPQPQVAAAAEPRAEPMQQRLADMKGSLFQVATPAMYEPVAAPPPPESAEPELELEGPIAATVEESPVDTADAADSMVPDGAEASIDVYADMPVEVAPDEPEISGALGAETPALFETTSDDTAVLETPTTWFSDSVTTEEPESPQPEMQQPPNVETAIAAPAIQPAPAPVRSSPAAAQPKVPEPTVEAETPTRDRGAAGLTRSEAIARSARMSALSSSRGNGSTAGASPAARPATVPPASQQQRPTEMPKHPGDLYGYWTRVKNGRRFPSRADFDVEHVAENFPNSMLLTCGPNGSSQVNFSSILRLGANRRARPGEELSFTSMITEWILAIGGEAARAGTPVQDTEVFLSPDGTFAYKIVALPLSDQQTRVDHVLCHLSRS